LQFLIGIEQMSRNDHAHDLVGVFENLVHAAIAKQPFNRIFPHIAVTSVDLQGFVAEGKPASVANCLAARGRDKLHGAKRSRPAINS
jgi:hypothetical protein